MFDFSAERTLQSVDESLRRLGLDYIDVIQVILKKPFTKTCVASQCHNLVDCINIFFMGVTNYPCFFLTFLYPVPVPKNCAIFIGCNFESLANKVEKPKEQ